MRADTGRIKSFEVLSVSAAYWLGQQTNDTLQRVYGVSFPDKKLMKEHMHRLEEAKKVRPRAFGWLDQRKLDASVLAARALMGGCDTAAHCCMLLF